MHSSYTDYTLRANELGKYVLGDQGLLLCIVLINLTGHQGNIATLHKNMALYLC